MKRLVLLCCVVSLVLLSGCADWDLLLSDSSEIADLIEHFFAYSDYSVTLQIQRNGQQAAATNPIDWYVTGEITLAVRPFQGKDLFLVGTGREATSGWTFTGGGCTGSGEWPVMLFVSGFFYGEPDCFFRLSVVETWVGGGTSNMVCDVGGGSAANPTLGYRFEDLTFNVENSFTEELPGAGIPSPGAAGDSFGQWSWQNTWDIVEVNLPEITGCYFDIGP